MALSVTIDSKRLINVLQKHESYVTRGLYAQARKVGERFLAQHKKVALSGKRQAASGPLVSSKRGFIGRRRVTITGTYLKDLELKIGITSGAAVAHQEGRAQTAKDESRLLPVPMPLARSSSGRLKPTARRLLRQFYHNAQASSQGFTRVLRTKRGGEQKQGLFLLEASDGRKFLVLRRGGGLRFLFHLRRRVQLKPRFVFFETWKAYLPQAMMVFRDGLKYALKAALKKGGGAP